MAKRKRLEPARNADTLPPLEVKSALSPRGPLAATNRPPIADVAHDASATAALVELADAMQSARDTGRLIQRLPLTAIIEDHLVRDRLADEIDRTEMEVLVESLRKRGQQTAIEVTDLGAGRYGLISGWRRLSALREISLESPELDTVLAIVRTPADAAAAYQAMVEENEVRVGLSFYERARIVVQAVNAGVFRADKQALQTLFEFVTRSKRSKINAFLPIVRAFEGALPFPTAVTEKQGLAMARMLDARPGFAKDLCGALAAAQPDSPALQTQVIADALRGDTRPKPVTAPEVTQIRAGLTMTVHPGGKVVLEGERMSEPHMLRRLKEALNNL